MRSRHECLDPIHVPLRRGIPTGRINANDQETRSLRLYQVSYSKHSADALWLARACRSVMRSYADGTLVFFCLRLRENSPKQCSQIWCCSLGRAQPGQCTRSSRVSRMSIGFIRTDAVLQALVGRAHRLTRVRYLLLGCGEEQTVPGLGAFRHRHGGECGAGARGSQRAGIRTIMRVVSEGMRKRRSDLCGPLAQEMRDMDREKRHGSRHVDLRRRRRTGQSMCKGRHDPHATQRTQGNQHTEARAHGKQMRPTSKGATNRTKSADTSLVSHVAVPHTPQSVFGRNKCWLGNYPIHCGAAEFTC